MFNQNVWIVHIAFKSPPKKYLQCAVLYLLPAGGFRSHSASQCSVQRITCGEHCLFVPQ